WLREIMALWLAGGVQPSGFQSAAGIRMAKAPIIIEQKYRAPMTTKVWTTPTEVGELKCFISATDMGEAMKAPPPKPMMAIPVAMPRLSGNHLISVDTGDT